MAFLDGRHLAPLAGHAPADLLAQHIRKDIQLCWLLQEPDKRSQEDVRRVILGLVEDQLKDLNNIVKDI